MDVVYRASELGGCTKFLIAKRMGYTEMKPPAKFQGYYERGEQLEETLADLMTGEGYEVMRRQETVELPVTSSVSVVGHIDGVVFDGETAYLWECKRVTPAVFDEFKEKGWECSYPLLAKYKWQVSVYMIATGLELRFDIACERDGVLERWSLYRELPFYSELQIKTHVLMVEASAINDGLPNTCDKPSYPCPFYYLPGHDNDDADETDEVLDALAKAVVDATAETKSAKDRETDLRKQLLATMGARKKVRADSATVSVLRSTRTITDWDALGKALLPGFSVNDFQKKEDGDEYVRVSPRTAKDTE